MSSGIKDGTWGGGAVFGILVLVCFVPLSIVLSVLFYMRRDIQPIKARSPMLVLITDVVLILYVVALSIQRMFVDDYPCLINLWSSYVGSIVLFNTYLWRSWSLYLNFLVVNMQMETNETEPSEEEREKKKDHINKLKSLASASTLTPWWLGTLGILCLPALGQTIFDGDVRSGKGDGDGCPLGWSRYLVGVYTVVYAILFGYLSVKLGQIKLSDNFMIKNELKFTGIIAVIAVIPWLLFNQFLRSINEDVFPFSTLSLIIAVIFAFGASTIWPLFRSKFLPPEVSIAKQDLISNIGSTDLRSLITNKTGFIAFRKFLSAEFSVENVLFWCEVDELRKKLREPPAEFSLETECKKLHAKYIAEDAPFQVNLPDQISSTLTDNVRQGRYSPPEQEMKSENEQKNTTGPATIFDAAQENIYKLMEGDSFPRFKSSDEYKKLCETFAKNERDAKLLQEHNLV